MAENDAKRNAELSITVESGDGSGTAEPPLARSQNSATETAQALLELVSDRAAFPDAAAQQLAELLGHTLAVGSAAERRQARLGLLIELVAHGEGEFIASSLYEEIRCQRNANGEEWPAASTLTRAYGHWITAVRAACRYWFDGGQARVAHSHAHTKRVQSYHPQEIRNALLQAQAELGLVSESESGDSSDGVFDRDHWPTEWEYLEWARIKRRLARKAGVKCRLPERGPICTAYGTYAAAVEAVAQISAR